MITTFTKNRGAENTGSRDEVSGKIVENNGTHAKPTEIMKI